MVMKKIILACAFLFFLCSCSEDQAQNNDPVIISDDESGLSVKNPEIDLGINYDIENEVLSRPQFEAIEVTNTKITLNWFDPTNWFERRDKPDELRFTLSYSTDPNVGNLVSTTEFSQTHQVELEGFQADTSYYFRLTAHPPEGDTRYLPSQPSLLSVHTLPDSNSYMGGLIVQAQLGKVTFKWPPLDQPGPIKYVLHLMDDPSAPTPFEEIVTRDTEIPDFALQGGRDYWLRSEPCPPKNPPLCLLPPFLSNSTPRKPT